MDVLILSGVVDENRLRDWFTQHVTGKALPIGPDARKVAERLALPLVAEPVGDFHVWKIEGSHLFEL